MLQIWIRIDFGRLNPDPDPKAKMTHKNRKKWRNFMFYRAGCSPLGLNASPVFCTSFVPKILIFSCTCFPIFIPQNPGPAWPKCWMRIHIETKAVPQHCSKPDLFKLPCTRQFLPKNERVFIRLSVRQDNLVELFHYLDCEDSHVNEVKRNKIFTPNKES